MYGFIITKDHLQPLESVADLTGAIRLTGRGISDGSARLEFSQRLRAGEGAEFRLYDDDDNLYYTGRFIGDSDGEQGFFPLNWAEADSGCTRIDYLRDGQWRTL